MLGSTALHALFARISCNTFLESLKHTDQPWVVFVAGTWNLIKNCLSLLCYCFLSLLQVFLELGSYSRAGLFRGFTVCKQIKIVGTGQHLLSNLYIKLDFCFISPFIHIHLCREKNISNFCNYVASRVVGTRSTISWSKEKNKRLESLILLD